MSSIEGILTEDERQELIPAVASFTAGNPAKLKTVIPEQHLLRIRIDQVPEEYAFYVIRYCELSAWIENPALIIQLLQKWDDRPIFANAINRIKNGQPPKYHIGDRIWDPFSLAVTLPFINRKITRRSLEHFLYPLIPTTKPPGVRVLVVKGPDKSGKSFTYDYIRYTNSFLTNLNFRLAWVDHKKMANARFGPLDLTKALLDQINRNWKNEVTIPALDDQQPSRWIQQLCLVIAEQIAITNTKCIIVLDNFGLDPNKTKDTTSESDQLVPRDTVEMIMQLAAISTGSERSDISQDLMRLVLLGFDYPVSNYMNRIRVDDIQPLTRDDIKEYFLEYAKFYEIELDAVGLEDMINAVMSGDDPKNPNRTENLAQLALNIAKGIINS